MLRKLHSLFGLTGFLLVLLLALSGAMLSVYPMISRLAPEAQATAGISVGDLAAKVQRTLPEVESLKRMPSGAIVANSYDANGMAVQTYVDAATGAVLHPVPPRNPLYRVLRDFHRDFLVGNPGRYVSGLGAVLLALLALSGILVLVSRMGGLSRLFAPAKGNWSHRTHVRIARWVLLPLLVTSLSGAYMVLAEFEYVPLNNAQSQLYPASADGLPAVNPDKLHTLADMPLSTLRELTYPMAGDRQDVFTLKTGRALLMVDQYSGDVLEQVSLTWSEWLYDWIYSLHTGKGLALVGLVLGVAALGVPVLGATGSVIWWKRRRQTRHRIKGNTPAAQANVVVLVGSEGGTTWGFARALHRDLGAVGLRVHVAAMNTFRPDYPRARLVLLLPATYGNGNAPTSADRFLAHLSEMSEPPSWSYGVLGFGDRAFPQFCEFAKEVDMALANQGAKRLLATGFINRQSTQAFANWGNDLSAAIDKPLRLTHQIDLPPTRALTLVGREIYGEEVQAATAVLRFRYEPQRGPNHLPNLWDRLSGRDGKRPRFAPSDLLGVLTPGSRVPRYYSVASAGSDDMVEICVRKQPGGECSTYLHALAPGDRITCFVRNNPDFQMPAGRAPVIMVAAGTGIAPFVGMIRANRRQRPIHLFWGGRDPQSDFLYRAELEACETAHHLASLTTAFSRVQARAYVQDRLREDAARLCDMLRRGACVMVCGGDAMAQAAMAEFERILAPVGLSVADLRARGSYLEDIF